MKSWQRYYVLLKCETKEEAEKVFKMKDGI